MKKLVNILACLVFVFLLTSVSYAKSKNTEELVSGNVCASLEGDQCDLAKAAAKTVVYKAMLVCAVDGPDSQECTTANDNADRTKANAEYICSDAPQPSLPPTGPVALYSPEKKKTTERLKVIDSELFSKDNSVS